MFTGLVEGLGTVSSLREDSQGRRLHITEPTILAEISLGDSVAINGCCLTVVEHEAGQAEFAAGPETLRKTNLGELQVGERVNLERSLPANGRLGGHIVLGHVDGTATIRSRQQEGEWETFWFEAGALTEQMVPKGSVAVDGVSLTVVEVTAGSFSVALIPHTLQVTTLGFKDTGDTVNLETDILGKYVLKYLGQLQASGNLTLEKLRLAGFA